MTPILRLFSMVLALTICSLSISARTLELDSSQVTAPAIALSPDGNTLIFTMLGHLFSMASTGGMAEQLTFGPYYDDDPAFSPDGSRVAFTSDRDGNESNIFIMTISDRRIAQLTHDQNADRPVWSPSGRSIAYRRHGQWTPESSWPVPSSVMRAPTDGGQTEIVSLPARAIGDIFYFPDGELGWSEVERGRDSGDEATRIEVLSSLGTISTLVSVKGYADFVKPSPSGDGLYCHRYVGSLQFAHTKDQLIFVPIPSGPEREIFATNMPNRFAVSNDGKHLYVGDQGRQWDVALPTGERHNLAFRGHVKLEVQEISKPLTSSGNQTRSAPAILYPRLSPDGRTLVFAAAGFLWRQALDGGNAERLFQDKGLESDPAFSPDGGLLAYVRTRQGEDSIRVLDLKSGQVRIVMSAPGITKPSWAPDGKRLVAEVETGSESHVAALNLADGKVEQLVDVSLWSPRPQFSADNNVLYYSAQEGGVGTLFRLSLASGAKPERMTQLTRHLSDASISPNGKWLVFRRNFSIMIAPFGNGLIRDEDIRELSTQGGDTFAFVPDGVAVIYSSGGHVWRQPLDGGERREIPVHLDLPHPLPSPLLIRDVRVLDFGAAGFTAPTSLLVEDGVIRWIGGESDHSVPKGSIVLDASGRFAIPGLFDSHAHLFINNRSSYPFEDSFLAYGVTSLRDVGDWLPWLNCMRDREESTQLPLPRLSYSGDIFEGDRPYWADSFLQIDNENDARQYVQRFRQLGASFIKVYPSLSWPLKRVVADESHRLGMPVVGHGMSPDEIIKSITLGFFSLEHVTWSPAFDDILKLFAVSGTRADPTITVNGGGALLLRDDPERLTDEKFRAFAPPWFIDSSRQWAYNSTGQTNALRGIVQSELESVRRAHSLGVELLVGTDAGNPAVFFGASLHWELARFVEAGIPPIDALRFATERAAEIVGAKDLGTIAPGKRADIVLLRTNPLEDIHNTEAIWRVIKGGWLFNPEVMLSDELNRDQLKPNGSGVNH